MYRFLKTLHLLGLTLFLGSVFGHIVASRVGGAIGDAAFLTARADIEASTSLLTLPGLGLALLSGIALIWLAPARRAWMGLHAGLATVIALLTLLVIAPAGRRVLSATTALAQGQGTIDAVHAALTTEHLAGAVNVVLALAVLALGVCKPALRRRSAHRAPPVTGEPA
ncbi:MAG: DUF2269 family protein [Rhodospirillales bacterium]|nr:DUF2269 family protein [Rhodospirillales bacterium]